MEIKQGFYLELSNRSTSRIVFSAATDELSPEAFQRLWEAIGNTIWSGIDGPKPMAAKEQTNYYELRVSPIRG